MRKRAVYCMIFLLETNISSIIFVQNGQFLQLFLSILDKIVAVYEFFVQNGQKNFRKPFF